MQTKQILLMFIALACILIFIVTGAILLVYTNPQTDMEGMMGGGTSGNSWVISVILFGLAFVIAIGLILYFVFPTKGQNGESHRTIFAQSRSSIGNQMAESDIVTHIKTPKIEGRVGTGNQKLDSLLYGGIPPKMAVALTMPISDEGNALIKGFIETGAKNNEITFYVTIDPFFAVDLSRKFPSNFYLFVTNPQTRKTANFGSNVFALKGIENLTDINIALTKAFRNLDTTNKGPRRICLNVISDILLEHGPVQTRKWLSELLTALNSEGFTVLAVINPKMHSSEEVQAILGLFDGEINIRERETIKEFRRFIKIKRMGNQKYLKNEIVLTED
jgi:hypothetical protein